MVVDTVQQGQTCIEYLRKQNVGRANFLVLEKIDETNGMRSIQTPENVPRLFDLVKLEGNKIPARMRSTRHYVIRWSLRISRKQTALHSVRADGGWLLSPESS